MKNYSQILAALLAICAAWACDEQALRKSEVVKDLSHWADYGNYCGAYNDKKNTDPATVDSLDACCKTHDKAYGALDEIHVELCGGDAQEDADNALVACVEALPQDSQAWSKPPEDPEVAYAYIQAIRLLFGWCE